jgi:alkylation response protein AidB-like acyl-CoA dehydrogenase
VTRSVLTPSELNDDQRDALARLRDALPWLATLPDPGRGTWARWCAFICLGRCDLADARLGEGHADATSILRELNRPDLVVEGEAWGVWAAEPQRLSAKRVAGGWQLIGEKRWCSGSVGLDFALVTAASEDGPRLFAVRPLELQVVPGSWSPLGLGATASHTMRFDLAVDEDHAVGETNAYVARPGFHHGGAGVAACWFGGALGVAERLARSAHHRPELAARWGRVRAALELAEARLRMAAADIDADPNDIAAARRRAAGVRIGVNDVSRDAANSTVDALGASALCHDAEQQRKVADLLVYLSQHHSDTDATAYGSSGDDGWWRP